MITRNFTENSFGETLTCQTEGHNLMKAALFNLIAAADSPQKVLHCQKLVHLITEKFPCQVIFVQADEVNQTNFFHTERTVQVVGSGDSRVCFDQITVDASLDQLHKVPFLILSNIMADLPVYLLLGQNPTEDQIILPQLQKYANRVIFDLDSVENLQGFSEKMLTLMHGVHCHFVDMNWARIRLWREGLATVFNDKERLAELSRSKTIQISFSCPASHKPPKSGLQAIYLQAWLASRLNWTLVDVKNEEGYLNISYQSDGQPISISLVPRDTESVEPGSLFSIEIMTQDESHFLISHEGEGSTSHVTVHASNLERCEMPYTLFQNNYQTSTSLIQEILYQQPSDHYKDMLQALNTPFWAKSIS